MERIRQGIEIWEGVGDTEDGIKLGINGEAHPRLHLTPQGVIKAGAGAAAPVAQQSGLAVLEDGEATVANTAVAATSRILLTVNALGTVTEPAPVAVTTKTAGVSFVITSAEATDTSTVAWVIVPA